MNCGSWFWFGCPNKDSCTYLCVCLYCSLHYERYVELNIQWRNATFELNWPFITAWKSSVIFSFGDSNVKLFWVSDLLIMLRFSFLVVSCQISQCPQFNTINVKWHYLISLWAFISLYLLIFLLLHFCLLSFSSGCFSFKGEDRLFRRLFRRYNMFIRPVENVSDPVTVEFEVSMSQLVKVVRVWCL